MSTNDKSRIEARSNSLANSYITSICREGSEELIPVDLIDR